VALVTNRTIRQFAIGLPVDRLHEVHRNKLAHSLVEVSITSEGYSNSIDPVSANIANSFQHVRHSLKMLQLILFFSRVRLSHQQSSATAPEVTVRFASSIKHQIRCYLLLLTLLLGRVSVVSGEVPKLPRAKPEDVGMSSIHLRNIDRVVADGLKVGRMPGCVVLIGRQGKVVFERAYGQRAVVPTAEPMTLDTMFDMASITKPMATAMSIMILIERGELRLRDKVSYYIPEFARNGKQDVTIYHLLTHQSGFIPDNADADYQQGHKVAMQKIYALTPKSNPGTKFIYSDVGFIVLGELVKLLTGQDVHEFSRENIFRRLGMNDTSFLPDERLNARIAPTEKRKGKWLRGQVHDPRAEYLGGVAGHAGLFSTADDIAVYAQMMLNQGTYAGVRILSPRGVTVMTENYVSGTSFRGLGWDKQSTFSTNRGEFFTDQAYGHSGFTGTSLWVDPGLDLFVIVLSNRVHPDGKGQINPVSGRIGTIAAAAILELPSSPCPPSRTPTAIPTEDSAPTDEATTSARRIEVRSTRR
jgi:CubicO group peptidase (beta-lactamase class C family)